MSAVLLLALAGCGTNIHDPVFGVALERYVLPREDTGGTKTDVTVDSGTGNTTGTATGTSTGDTAPAPDTATEPSTGTATGTATGSDTGPDGPVNRPPELPDVLIEPANPRTGDTLVAIAASRDPEDDPLTYTITWARNGQTLRTPTETVAGARVRRGDAWSATVVASDGLHETAPVTVETTIGNAPPVATVTLEATAPGPDQDVTARGRAVDPEGDATTLRYQWTREGLVAPVEGATLPASETTQGQLWTVSVIPSDGVAEGVAALASVRIRNHPPTVGRVTLDPSVPRTGDALVARVEDVDDPDGDAVALRWTFHVDDAVVQDGPSDTLPPGSAARDQLVHVVVTPDDGFDVGRGRASSPVMIRNTPPSGAAATVVAADGSGIVRRSTGATCAPAGWFDPDNDPERWTFAWSRNGAPLSVATATVDTAGWARGDTVACTATPRDATDVGVPLTSATRTLGNTPPTLSGATLSTSSPAAGDTLAVTLVALADADGDAVTPGYAWFVDGVQRGAGPGFDTTGLRRGQRVAVRVTPWDGQDAGTPVDSDEAVLVNAAPRLDAVTLVPASPTTNTVLRADVQATDGDADPLVYAYAWTVDGVPVDGNDAPTLDGAAAFDKGDTVTVSVRVRDPEGAEDGPLPSAAVIVADTLPSPPVLRLVPTQPRAGVDALDCEVTGGGSDPDAGDTVAQTLQWYLNSAATGRTGAHIPAADLVAGQVWTCRVRVTSSGGGAAEASRSTVVR
ncbi:MAG: hypothetical protein RLZZ299_1270 [Pseudomonadota bacterium]